MPVFPAGAAEIVGACSCAPGAPLTVDPPVPGLSGPLPARVLTVAAGSPVDEGSLDEAPAVVSPPEGVGRSESQPTMTSAAIASAPPRIEGDGTGLRATRSADS